MLLLSLSCPALPTRCQDVLTTYKHICRGKGHRKAAGRSASLPSACSEGPFLPDRRGGKMQETKFSGISCACKHPVIPWEKGVFPTSSATAAAVVSQQGNVYFGSQRDSFLLAHPREWSHCSQAAPELGCSREQPKGAGHGGNPHLPLPYLCPLKILISSTRNWHIPKSNLHLQKVAV